MGDQGDIARAQHNLGYVALREGDVAQAQALFKGSLALFQTVGIQRGIAECLVGLASTAASQGTCPAIVRAARLLGAAEGLREATGMQMWPADRREHDRVEADTHAHLDETAWAAAWAEGRAMTLEQAIAYALEETKDA